MQIGHQRSRLGSRVRRLEARLRPILLRPILLRPILLRPIRLRPIRLRPIRLRPIRQDTARLPVIRLGYTKRRTNEDALADSSRSANGAQRFRLEKKRRHPRPTGRGYLSVDTRPWSRVYVDGRRVGITPIWRLRVAAGWRRVRLVGTGRRKASRRVRIRRGRHANLGMIVLR